jgi:hypothetical protein
LTAAAAVATSARESARELRLSYVDLLSNTSTTYPFDQSGGVFLPVKNAAGLVKYVMIGGKSTGKEKDIFNSVDDLNLAGDWSSASIKCFEVLDDPPNREPLVVVAKTVRNLAAILDNYVQDETTINIFVWCHQGKHRSVATVLAYLMSFWLLQRKEEGETVEQFFGRALAMVSVMRPVAFEEPQGNLRTALWGGRHVPHTAKHPYSWADVVVKAYDLHVHGEEDELF